MNQVLKSLLIQDAAYWDAPMNEVKIRAWAEQLQGLDPDQVHAAMKHFRDEKGRREMPKPADIKAFLNPTVSDDGLAREAAARVIEAISRFGYMRGAEAKEWIGELGWSVVKVYGWEYICENCGVGLQVGQLTAQIRDLAKSHLEMARAGKLNQAPELPPPTNTPAIEGLPKVRNLLEAVKK